MTEVLFYHLERRTLEQVLPTLLEKTLERGWRALVLAGSKDRVDLLGGHLWTYRDDSFLPHGVEADGLAERQPVFLTDQDENPNGANVLFLVDGAESKNIGAYDRCVDLFDGNDERATEAARGRYRLAKESGYDVTYWQQDDKGKWVKRS